MDEHYAEFLNVTRFLSATEEENREFKEIWRDYSLQLRAFAEGDVAVLEAKDVAEDALFFQDCPHREDCGPGSG